MNSDFFFNALGIAGACLLLFGFYRTSIGKWDGKSLWYELDNLAGATMVVIYQLHHGAYITSALNVIWGLFAVWGIVMFVRRYRSHPQRGKRRAS